MLESQRAESVRDQSENAFTPILRRLYCTVPALAAAVLVDAEGECIDCVAEIEPYEAKVTGAHVHMLMQRLRGVQDGVGAGDTYAFEVVTSQREVWASRVGEEYVLVAVLSHGFDRTELRDAMARAAREFRGEVGIPTPPWEGRERLNVRLRSALGWEYAPDGYSLGGERVAIAAVLGRWVERPGHGQHGSRTAREQVVCFRVRTQHGQELTLVHDERTEVWQMRD